MNKSFSGRFYSSGRFQRGWVSPWPQYPDGILDGISRWLLILLAYQRIIISNKIVSNKIVSNKIVSNKIVSKQIVSKSTDKIIIETLTESHC
jgi:hypothetical protein